MLNNINGGNCNNKDLDRINESCNHCKRHLTKIKDIRLGVLDDQYYCEVCSKELYIEVTDCRDIL